MSQENVNAFFSKIEEDRNLSTRYKSFLKGVRTSDEEAALKEVVQFASQHGYEFSTEDLKLVAEEMQSGELNDEQLNAVAGGGGLRFIFGGAYNDSGDDFLCIFLGYSGEIWS